jgi:DNA-binding NarL/FixJ family response regulator
MNNIKNPISVYLVDDHPLVREGLKALFQSTDDINVTGEAGSFEESLPALKKQLPIILLLDIRLPGKSGIEACSILKQEFPQLKVIFLTSYLDTKMAAQALQAGADGYLLKEIQSDQLCESIRQVAAGQTTFQADVTKDLAEFLKNDHQNVVSSSAFNHLSEQEKRVSELVKEGLINKEIAERMELSEKTVRNYLNRIFSKLHISRRAQLAVLCEQNAKTLED